MSAQIIDGKALATSIQEKLQEKIRQHGITPGLTIILIGTDEPSHLYVQLKEKACLLTGIHCEVHLYFHSTPQEEIIQQIQKLNNQEDVHGILVQMPVPQHLDENKLVQEIDPKKDVDGFHPENISKLMSDQPSLISPVARGIVQLIQSTKTPLQDKAATIVVNSELFAQPIKKLLEQEGVSVTVCLDNDPNISEKTKTADILIVAVGKPNYITGDMVKENSIIIDIGTNRTDQGLVGDVDFESVKEKAAFISPVPGGVGPMTVALLLDNTTMSALAKS